MLEGNTAVFRRLYRAALVHPWSAVDFLHPVDGGIDHGQHKEHLPGRLQLAIYQESGNHHHQAGKEGHTALQENQIESRIAATAVTRRTICSNTL